MSRFRAAWNCLMGRPTMFATTVRDRSVVLYGPGARVYQCLVVAEHGLIVQGDNHVIENCFFQGTKP